MRNFYILLIILLLFKAGYSQTCTVTGASPLNWANPTGPACLEGGNANGKSILVIPSGFTLVFDSSGDTWTGTRIDVYGILLIDKDVTINSNITVHSSGQLILQSKLSIGTSAGCGYGLAIKTGGTVDVGGTGSDRLSVCGKELMKGNGSCNSCGGDNSGDCPYNGSPYCEPTGGFTGPLGYDETGYDGTLPIKLLSFSAQQEGHAIDLKWSTASEENFDKFIVEHSSDGQNFDSIGAINGAGNSQVLLKYSFRDSSPVIGKNYYRLKSIDFDLSFEYSYLVLAEFEGKKNVNIFPNPTRGTSIQVRTNFTPSVGDRVEFYDNVGLKLMEFNVSEVESTLLFNWMLKQGSYLLRYVSHDHVQVIRVSCNN